MKRIVMKNETRINSYIAGWALAVFLAVAGVSTWYSTNKTMMGLGLAIVLMAGFLFSLKVASAFLFDNRNSGGLRFASLVFLFCLVTIDIFGGSHSLQTGTMKRVVTETTSSSTYQSNLRSLQVIQDQLADCPAKYYTKCKKPLSAQLEKAQAALNQGSGTTGSVEAKFWQALTDAINSMSDEPVELHDVVFYTYVLIMAVASMLTIYLFGILGSALIDNDGDGVPDYDPREPDPKPTGTDDQSSRNKDKGFGLLGGRQSSPAPATASTSNQPKAEAKPVRLSTPPRSGSEPFYGKPYDQNGTHYEPIRNQAGVIISQSRSGASVGDFSKAFEKKHQRPAPKLQVVGNLAIKEDVEVDVKQVKKVDASTLRQPTSTSGGVVTSSSKTEIPERFYQEWKQQVIEGLIKPTLPPTKKFISQRDLVKGIKNIQGVADGWFVRGCKEGFISKNPDWTHARCGLAKYLLA